MLARKSLIGQKTKEESSRYLPIRLQGLPKRNLIFHIHGKTFLTYLLK